MYILKIIMLMMIITKIQAKEINFTYKKVYTPPDEAIPCPLNQEQFIKMTTEH